MNELGYRKVFVVYSAKLDLIGELRPLPYGLISFDSPRTVKGGFPINAYFRGFKELDAMVDVLGLIVLEEL